MNDSLPSVATTAVSATAVSAIARPLTILHTVSSLKFGGMEQFVVRLATVQQRAGHDVGVMALNGGPLEEPANKAGLSVLKLAQSGSVARYLSAMLQASGFRPDIVHAHNPTSLHYASGAAMLCRAKLVLTDHGQCSGVVRTPLRWETRRVNALVSVSGDVGRKHSDLFPYADRQTVIYNGVEFSKPHTTRDEIHRQLDLPSGPTLVVVARVEPVKDHETLLRAVSLLQKQGMPVNLLIVGDGRESGRLKALLPDLGLSAERIRFLGFRTDVPELLHAADIFVLSSLGEGLPLAVLEAMGQGLPVAATSVGGVPELISNRETGLLVPPQSPGILAEALAELIRKPELRRRLGHAAALRVKTHFSFNEMAQQYEDLYRSLLHPNAPMHRNGSLSENFG